MSHGIRKMKALGFIDTTEGRSIVRQFTRYDEEGYITDIINYFIDDITGVEVYVNNLKYQCGSRVDMDLLNAILINFKELAILEILKEGK